MKRTNPRHEFDDKIDFVRFLHEKYDGRIAIFGAGMLGQEFLSYIQQIGKVECYIDNNSDVLACVNNLPVVSLASYLAKENHGMIVICVGKKHYEEIKMQLNQVGLKQDIDYCYYRSAVPIYMAYMHNKSYMELAQICITERCTLRCAKCAHGCYAVDRNFPDMSIEDVKKNADAFFAKIDYIHEFVLIGGEPLLHKQISECITYIGEYYRDKINTFSITTNGTLLPDEETMKACRKYRVLYRISNYSGTIPALNNQYKKLTNCLIKQGIEFQLSSEEKTWYDYGFDYLKPEDLSEDILIDRFDRCNTPCRDIHDEKLYFCVMARSVSENLGFNVGKTDFLDLKSLPNGRDGVMDLLEFNQGYSEKGYLDMCARCYGAECINHPIPAAEQKS